MCASQEPLVAGVAHLCIITKGQKKAPHPAAAPPPTSSRVQMTRWSRLIMTRLHFSAQVPRLCCRSQEGNAVSRAHLVLASTLLLPGFQVEVCRSATPRVVSSSDLAREGRALTRIGVLPLRCVTFLLFSWYVMVSVATEDQRSVSRGKLELPAVVRLGSCAGNVCADMLVQSDQWALGAANIQGRLGRKEQLFIFFCHLPCLKMPRATRHPSR